jgi:hypothetical protein
LWLGEAERVRTTRGDHSHSGLVEGAALEAANFNPDIMLRQLRQCYGIEVTTVTARGPTRSVVFNQS